VTRDFRYWRVTAPALMRGGDVALPLHRAT
jgi:hypothetical protein